MIQILNTLNIEQKNAAISDANYSLVVASAGTGKTKTIMARIEHLLNKNISPEEILVITFTSKASDEIKDRLLASFSKTTVDSLSFGTFHAIAYRHIYSFYPSAKIVNKFNALSLLRDAASKANFSFTEEKLSIYQLHYAISRFSVSREEDFEVFMDEFLEKAKRDDDSFLLGYVAVYNEYVNLKIKYNSFEFDDLLRYAIKYVDELNIKKYRHVIIDEYQDTNPLQESFIESMQSVSLFCVGDYDQSIYGFNGSDISIIENFTKKYKNSKYFNLSRNYRSAPKILELAEKVISRNKRIYPKQLISQYSGVDGNEKPQYLKFKNQTDQFHAIASYISSIPIEKRSDTAILFRGNSSADQAEIALNAFGIDYSRKNGSSFYEQEGIQIMLAVIKIASGSFTQEELIMAYHNKSVRSVTIDEFYKNIANHGAHCFDYPKIANNTEKYSDAMYLHIKEYIELRKKCVKIKKTHLLIERAFESDFFKKIIKSSFYSKNMNPDEAKRRLENAQNILIDSSKNHKSLKNFLGSLAKKQSSSENINKVNLLSIHSSKGLEFNAVFLADLTEKKFPNKRLIDSGGTLEEERRLFYVAVTRAKNVLWLCYPEKTNSGTKLNPSLFAIEAGYEKWNDEQYY